MQRLKPLFVFGLLTAVAVFCLGPNQVYASGGVIKGKVTYADTIAKKKKLTITKDVNVCGKVAHYSEKLLVSKDRGLANVLVQVLNVKGGQSLESMGTKFEMDQNGCLFKPHVAIVPVEVGLKIKNSDGILHNIHTFGEENPPINKAQPKFLKMLKVSFDEPEIVRIACDVHNWMTGYIAVVDHPYYAVTDAAGNFELTGVPKGTYTLEYWHESLGVQTQKITVKDGATTDIKFEF